jgi:hypothetical protein
MANFIELKKQFSSFKDEYDQKEKDFLNEIFFYLADKSEEFYQHNLKSENTQQANEKSLQLLYFTIKPDSSNKHSIKIDFNFNSYAHNLQINKNNYPYIEWKNEFSIQSLVQDFVENTIADRCFSEIFCKWLKKNNDSEFRIIHRTNASETLINQFEKILGSVFSSAYEKRKLESIISEVEVVNHKIKI